MLELMSRQEMFFFVLALMLTVLFFVIELVLLMVGGTSEWIDALLPEGVGETSGVGAFVGLLNWLYIGRVPLLMVLVIFWTVFGVAGLLLQYVVYWLMGRPLPSLVAVPVVLAVSLPIVRQLAKALYKVLPKDETSAVDSSELIGRVGTIVTGVATRDKSAQVKVKDLHGQTHYVMALSDDEPLTQGQSVLLVAKDSSTFTAIKSPSAALTD